MKKKILFYFILIFFLFLATEIAARILIAQPKIFEMLSRNGELNDSSIWRLQWVKRKQEEAKDNPEKLMFSYAAHHPQRGWQLKKSSSSPNEFYARGVHVNKKGIRGVREYSYERVAGKKRILIFGDSFTFGTEVGDNETYPYYLQQMLPEAEVINMGVFGYGHDQMLLYLKEEGMKYRPDVVIIGYMGCDDSRNLLSFRDYAKPYFVLKSGKLILKGAPVSPPEQFLKNEFWRVKTLDLINIAKRNVAVKSGAYEKAEQKMADAILEEMIATVESIGGVAVLAYLDGIRDNDEIQKALIPDIERFFSHWQARKVRTVFLLPVVEAAKKEKYKNELAAGKPVYLKREFGHFSPWENQIIAAALRNYLIKQDLL